MQLYKQEWNEFNGCMESYYWDPQTETMHIKNVFDVTSVIEANKKLHNASLDSRYGNAMMHHVAEIPNVFITKIKKEHDIDVLSGDPTEQRKLRRLLELPEYRFLKTTVKKLWRPKGATNGS